MVYNTTKTVLGRCVRALWKISDPTGSTKQTRHSSHWPPHPANLNNPIRSNEKRVQRHERQKEKTLLIDMVHVRSYPDFWNKFRNPAARFPFQGLAFAMNGMCSPSGLQDSWLILVWIFKAVSTKVIGSEIRNDFPENGIFEWALSR